jgi:recombination protein RecR
MIAGDLDRLIQLLARLPGLGPRSARRAVLHLMKKREALMLPLAEAMARAAETVTLCSTCGNLDTRDPCGICQDPSRDARLLCVVEDVADLWALERSGAFKGRYHVLGGTLSAIDGRGPEQLNMGRLVARATAPGTGTGSGTGGSGVEEVILALSATVDGQTTAHYISERLTGGRGAGSGVKVSRLAHGVPVGGELDYLDDGTLTAALKARRPA